MGRWIFLRARALHEHVMCGSRRLEAGDEGDWSHLMETVHSANAPGASSPANNYCGLALRKTGPASDEEYPSRLIKNRKSLRVDLSSLGDFIEEQTYCLYETTICRNLLRDST